MEQLLAERARWFRAYLDGDVATLDGLQADEFASTCRLGSQAKAAQLEGIASAVRESLWFPENSKVEDAERKVLMFGDIALVHGFIHTDAFGWVPPRVAFTEVWQCTDSGWRALRMHFSDAKR